VDEAEAKIVIRIYEMSASGLSYKTIAKTLNAERVPSPRPRAGNHLVGWCPTTIRVILHNELYIGTYIWPKTHWIKAPGTNSKLSREVPRIHRHVIDHPDLRIISDELWQRVQARLVQVKQVYGNQERKGLMKGRAVTSPNLLSGLVRCGGINTDGGPCGAGMTVVSGRHGHQHGRYGCPNNFNRGTCTNDLRVRRDWLEERLLAGLQEQVLKQEVVDYAIQEFERQLRATLGNRAGESARLSKEKVKLEVEITNLTAAVAAAGHSSALLSALAQREDELRDINDRLQYERKGSIEGDLSEMRRFVTEQLGDLRKLLYQDVAQARTYLGRHLPQITLKPDLEQRHYIACGDWDLTGGRALGHAPCIAGPRNVPNCDGFLLSSPSFAIAPRKKFSSKIQFGRIGIAPRQGGTPGPAFRP
jgi:hypothetical protein